MSDKTREDFEAWAHKSPANIAKDAAGGYQSATVAFAWRAVQAATQHSAARIAELEAEVQALRRDAERLDWLLGDGRRMAIDSFGGQYRIVDASCNLVVTDWMPSQREAIDTAIEAERAKS